MLQGGARTTEGEIPMSWMSRRAVICMVCVCECVSGVCVRVCAHVYVCVYVHAHAHVCVCFCLELCMWSVAGG